MAAWNFPILGQKTDVASCPEPDERSGKWPSRRHHASWHVPVCVRGNVGVGVGLHHKSAHCQRGVCPQVGFQVHVGTGGQHNEERYADDCVRPVGGCQDDMAGAL